MRKSALPKLSGVAARARLEDPNGCLARSLGFGSAGAHQLA
jgi:hypothetical protein